MKKRALMLSLLALGLGACSKTAPPEAAPKPAQPYIAVVPVPAPNAAAVVPAPADPHVRQMLNDWLSAWNAHDASQAAGLLADDVEYFDAGFAGILHGRDAAMERGFSTFLRGVPDLHMELRGEPIVGKDAVAWEWTFTGTNTGTWGGVPATNQHIQLKGFSLMRLRGNRIVQLSSYYDTGTLNRQLGL